MSVTPIKVLLVEDDLGDAEILCELLELVPETSFEVTQSRRLQEALEYLHQQIFDVLLLDLSLPDSQGLDTVSRIYGQVMNLPIVILSGLEDQSLATVAVQEGAQDYLVKGHFNSDLLARAIRYAIERARHLKILSDREEQLKRANEDLEHRVEERVAEIKQANAHLRELEAQLRQALEQEKRLNNFKSQIITTISHGYRTPLTTILSSAELIELYSNPIHESKKIRHLRHIKDGVQQIKALVDNVLFLNQLESAELSFHPICLNFDSFLSEFISEYKTKTNLGQPHELVLTMEGRVGEAKIDVNLLQTILTHLLDNAVKYSPQGGEIEVRLTGDDEHITLQVLDNGIGIPPEEVNTVFDSFQRGSNAQTFWGVGLGLAIVRGCVDLHQGEISLESELGVGSTVTLKLSRY